MDRNKYLLLLAQRAERLPLGILEDITKNAKSFSSEKTEKLIGIFEKAEKRLHMINNGQERAVMNGMEQEKMASLVQKKQVMKISIQERERQSKNEEEAILDHLIFELNTVR